MAFPVTAPNHLSGVQVYQTPRAGPKFTCQGQTRDMFRTTYNAQLELQFLV